jgi:hypothetical protein
MSSKSTTRRATDSPFGRAIPIARFGEVQVLAHWSVLVILLLIANLLATTVLPEAVAGESALVYWMISTGAAAVFILASSRTNWRMPRSPDTTTCRSNESRSGCWAG